MRILSDPDSYSKESSKPLYLGLGNFDGLHLGHQQLLRRLTERARKNSGLSAVFTFQSHPQRILHPENKTGLLTPAKHKLFLLSELGIDICFSIPFTLEFSKMPAETFVRDLLVNHLGVRGIEMGYNAFFGHNREGNIKTMKTFSQSLGFDFEEVAPVTVGGEHVSSSRIRRLVKEGSLKEAAECFGRPFSVIGKVVKGSGRGRKIGFPTANLLLENDVMPPLGVYPVKVRTLEIEIKKQAGKTEESLLRSKHEPWQGGVLNYGMRPTFDGDEGKNTPAAEVYLMDFEGDLYGRELEVGFYPRLRTEKPFKDADSLTRQIREDIKNARLALAE